MFPWTVTQLAYLVFNLGLFYLVSQGTHVHSRPGDKHQTEGETGHTGSGFWFSNVSLPGSGLASHCAVPYLCKAPTSSSCLAEVHIMQCWAKTFPAVNKTDPRQDFLALSDCRATAEQSLSPSSAWAPSSPFLTPPLGPFNIIWEIIFQNMAVLSCFLVVKLHSEAGLKKKAAVSLPYLMM